MKKHQIAKSITRSRTLALALSLSSIVLLTACGETSAPVAEVVTPPKEVEIFTVGDQNGQNSQTNQQSSLTFTKSAKTESAQEAYVIPQTAGKVTKILVKTGDKVQKGQLLLALGDSLATDAANISYDTAQKGLNQLDISEFKLNYAAQKDIQSVYMGYYAALESLKNTLNTREHAADLYDEQHDYIKDSLDNLKDALNQLEDTFPDYENNATYIELKSKYDLLKSQKEQAEIGNETQTDQLDYALEMARQGLNSSILAVEGVQAKYALQFVQLDSSIIQAKSGAELARLQKEAQNIKSPIDGTVTSVIATENNMTAPGQMLMTVENLDNLKIKTSVNAEEAPLLKVGDKVKILPKNSQANAQTLEGTITMISPTLSAQDNKIAVEIEPALVTRLISGSLVNIVFTPNTDSIFIPLRTVNIEDETYYVKIINLAAKDTEITKRTVTTGRILGEFIEITSGLTKGDMIATSTTTFLEEGDKVVYKVPFDPTIN